MVAGPTFLEASMNKDISLKEEKDFESNVYPVKAPHQRPSVTNHQENNGNKKFGMGVTTARQRRLIPRRGSNPRHLVKGGGALTAPPHPLVNLWEGNFVE
ncbi:hypothetical protein LguiA_001869 [Lonicera macranthoides]